MTLLANIPGLARHEALAIPLPMSVPPTRFDRAWADRLISAAVLDIDAAYRPGALEWVRENRPDVAAYLRDASLAVCEAVNAEDGPLVTAAVDRFVEAHRRAIKLFEARPPVIEVDAQLDLMAAVG